jgi:hypothetical protein
VAMRSDKTDDPLRQHDLSRLSCYQLTMNLNRA